MEKPTDILKDLELRITKDTILFFDMDGTLVNTNFANYLSYKKAIQSVTQSETDIPYNPSQRFNREVLKNAIPNLTETEYEKIIQEKEQYYNDYLPETKLNKMVVDILVKYFKTNRTVLVTNCREDRTLLTLSYYGLTDKFSNIFYRQLTDNEEKINKFQYAISILDISPKSVIAFENEEIEIDDAMLAGIPYENIINITEENVLINDSVERKEIVEQKDGFSVRTIDNPRREDREEFLAMLNENSKIEIAEYEKHMGKAVTGSLMREFEIKHNNFLTQDIQGFYHTDFGGVELPNNPNFLYKLKNDPHHNWTDFRIQEAQQQLLQALLLDLPEISRQINRNPLTVCVVPRAKADNTYRPNQLLFKATVRNAVIQLGNNFIDGTNFIVRHTNTKTTHLRRPMEGVVNDGSEPYPGISSDTCTFSRSINGNNILLIDDIYTRTVNIDEDMIQSLLNGGANSVSFYAIGNTVHNH